MNENYNNLHRLLQQWRGIEPAGNFEANVWRKIRLARPTTAPTLAELVKRWLTQPAFALAAAAVIAVVVGSAAGVLTTRRPDANQEIGFFSTGTLAGGYAKLMAGGSQ